MYMKTHFHKIRKIMYFSTKTTSENKPKLKGTMHTSVGQNKKE